MPSSLPSPTLEPILFFFSNSLAIIASAAVLFFALGVIYGWLAWAKFKRRARAYQEETDLLRHEIARLKRHIAMESVSPGTAAAEEAVAEAAAAELALPTPAIEPEAPSADEPRADAPVVYDFDVKPALSEPRKESLASAVLGHAASKPHVLQAVAPPDELVNPTSTETSATEPVSEPPLAVPTEPLEIAPAPLTVPTPDASPAAPITEPSPAAVPPAAPANEQPPVSSEATPEPASVAPVHLATLAFAADLAAGSVTHDSDLGILYATRPERWDDLTLLRGVAETVQHKLHDHGIYTFKQIATWSEHEMEHINQHLALKGRAQRDRWPQQARELHYLKYGEKLG